MYSRKHMENLSLLYHFVPQERLTKHKIASKNEAVVQNVQCTNVKNVNLWVTHEDLIKAIFYNFAFSNSRVAFFFTHKFRYKKLWSKTSLKKSQVH